MARAWTVLGLLAASILVGVVLGQPNASVEEAIDADCYSCHWNRPPTPMRAMYDIVPAAATQVAPGAPGALEVTVAHAWIGTITEVRIHLDLTDAPSLGFANKEPPKTQTLPGRMELEPTRPANAWRGLASATIPAGATDLVLVATPNATGLLSPDIRVTAKLPDGSKLSADDAGPGQSERIHLKGAGALASAAGNWQIVVEADLDDPAAAAAPGFEVQVTTWSNTSAERRAFQAAQEPLVRSQSHSFQWLLALRDEPAPGEVVRIMANGTAFFAHQPSSVAQDWGNFTKTFEIPVLANNGALLTANAVQPPPLPPAALSAARVGEAIGYATGFLMLASLVSGGILGRASRRGLNALFGSAKRRVAFHNFTSYGLTAAALAHLILFLAEAKYAWTAGLLWGGAGFLALIALGFTGAVQIPLIRRWGYPAWRWVHLAAAWAAVALAIVHALLDGANFTSVQEALGYQDPLAALAT